MAQPLSPLPAREAVISMPGALITRPWLRGLDEVTRRLADQAQRLDALEARLDAVEPVQIAWTPTLLGTTGTSVHTYSVQWGVAIRTGTRYTIAASVALAAKDATMGGIVTLAGLPAVITGPPEMFIPLTLGFSNLALTGQYTSVVAAIVAGESALRLYMQGANTGWDLLTASVVTPTTQLAVSGAYFSQDAALIGQQE